MNQLPSALQTFGKSAIAMSGKGCQLLVSPCSVSPSLSVIRGHQSQSIRMPVSSSQQSNLSSSSGRMQKVKRGTVHSFASEKQSESHVVLPSLSLRRQVLTNGKHLNMPSGSPHQQPPTQHPINTKGGTTIQTRLSDSFKGKNKKNKKVYSALTNPLVWGKVRLSSFKTVQYSESPAQHTICLNFNWEIRVHTSHKKIKNKTIAVMFSKFFPSLEPKVYFSSAFLTSSVFFSFS